MFGSYITMLARNRNPCLLTHPIGRKSYQYGLSPHPPTKGAPSLSRTALRALRFTLKRMIALITNHNFETIHCTPTTPSMYLLPSSRLAPAAREPEPQHRRFPTPLAAQPWSPSDPTESEDASTPRIVEDNNSPKALGERRDGPPPCIVLPSR